MKIKKRYIDELKEEQEKIQGLLDARIRNIYKIDLAKQYIYMILKSNNIFELFQSLTSIYKIITFDKGLINKSIENQEIISIEISEINLKIKEQEKKQIEIEEKQNEIVSAKNNVVAIQNREEEKSKSF